MREFIARYKGSHQHLVGKQVLLHLQEQAPQDTPKTAERVKVQFDDTKAVLDNIKLGYGWHEFPASDFELLYELNNEDIG